MGGEGALAQPCSVGSMVGYCGHYIVSGYLYLPLDGVLAYHTRGYVDPTFG